MKNLSLILGFGFWFSGLSYGQNTGTIEIPKPVAEAFQQKFPDATALTWEQENKNEWEAEFKQQGKSYSANFDADGTWLETEYTIKVDELPAEVKTTLEKEFSGYKIEKAEVAETPKGSFYEIELEKGNQEMEVVLDSSGKVILKEVEDEHEEADED